ncbi:MAG: hypothetical protein M0Q01_01620 [Syntrophales bacterium]|jgi:hypothetical protein|nr:hypothetical protein [Syntrophales bacterium]
MEVELVKKNETIPDPSMRKAEIILETRDQSGDKAHFANHEFFNPEEVFSYYGP